MLPSNLLRLLIESWSSPNEPGRVRPGLFPAEIDGWEARNGVRLPDDVRTYLLAVNGMYPGDTDYAGIHFWGIDRIESVTGYYAERNGGRVHPATEKSFVLCDCGRGSFRFAVRIEPESDTPDSVIAWGEGTPTLVSWSFDAFLRDYIQDPGAVAKSPTELD